jgi:hypothetical protein
MKSLFEKGDMENMLNPSLGPPPFAEGGIFFVDKL